MDVTMEAPKEIRIQTARFGEVTFTASDLLEFPWGLPGFSQLRRYLALTLADQPNFVWLQSVDDPRMALPCSDPWQIFPDYDPKLPAYATIALELNEPDDFTLLCVVVVSTDARERTMNLLAPLLVNLKTRKGRQVMLDNSGYSIREPIPSGVAAAAS
ncbi:MAG: flagellar assembly protein FliW [Candidatus Eremiobacteraeota bacterium]|nr:flagellar assembly protein FliW [Candidatus Eremiobacteraeota bacterium]